MTPASSPSSGTSEATLNPLASGSASIAQQQCNHEPILKMTADVFPGAKIELGTSIDPEIEGDEYFVVSVTTAGDVMELVARDREWHHRLCADYRTTANCYVLDLNVA